ncbi:MAG: zinc metalloprotease HtpX [Pyrinomonas sp.]|uniref:zinc metalloprotease HtpX n=1 Tax=Pyrinomonas sp. TaxID=2080306 RepID=UPI003316F7F4
MNVVNGLKTALLLGALTALLVLLGGAIGGQSGMIFGFVLAIAMNFGSYWFSDRIALRMAGAHEVSEQEAPELHQMVATLAREAGLPKPRVAIIEADAPNAFATGRNPQHAVVAVTTGIMRILNQRELAAVIAHELGHIRNRDILISAVAATLAGAITLIAQMGQWAMIFGGYGRNDERDNGIAGALGALLMLILAPIAATLIQLAISRSREFGADRTGAEIVRDPEALASALEKLEAYSRRIPLPVNPAASHMFIVRPFTGATLQKLFSTHPPTEERIARLRAMVRGGLTAFGRA